MQMLAAIAEYVIFSPKDIFNEHVTIIILCLTVIVLPINLSSEGGTSLFPRSHH